MSEAAAAERRRHGRPKSLVLVLAREFASNLATPIYIADDEDTLVYYNEPAEWIAGRPFSETGEIPIRVWAQTLSVESIDGTPLRREELPSWIAHSERRAAHGRLRITGLDGRKREIRASAFPLLGVDDDFHGIMVIFWEQE